eukprot:3317437-Ditylum_brightwellii.AAC.1
MYIIPEQSCIYIHQEQGFIHYTQLCSNPKLYTNGITSKWVPPWNAYPAHVTSIDGAKTWMCKIFYTDTTFDSYLSTLDQWEFLLLQEIVLNKTVYKIAQICHTDTQINTASDGSSVEADNIMTFGWIIVKKDKEILAEHAGPSFGQATYFRVEGYGLLSVTRFIHHISQYTNQEVCCDVNMYIDNEDIVKKINDQLIYTYDYPSNTLKPDWDIVAQAAHTLKPYANTLTITHVKSHQDDNSLLEELIYWLGLMWLMTVLQQVTVYNTASHI